MKPIQAWINKFQRERVPGYRKQRGLLVMVVPCLAFFLLFHYVPMCGLVMAFQDYVIHDGFTGSRWVGLENFRRLFGGEDFPRALFNTLTISFLRLGFGFAAPIVLALMLNELRIAWYKRTIQTLSYLPYFFSWVILGGIFLMLLSSNGPINQITLMFQDRPIGFLTDRFWFVAVLIVTGIWQSAGYGAVVYLAALAGISPDLYEAAVVDGAGRWRQMIHITLPSLAPTIVVLFILSLSDILNAGFDQIYNLYNPIVYGSADIIDTYVLRRLLSMDFSLATAAGLFKSVVSMILIVLVNWLAKKMSHGEQQVW